MPRAHGCASDSQAVASFTQAFIPIVWVCILIMGESIRTGHQKGMCPREEKRKPCRIVERACPFIARESQ